MGKGAMEINQGRMERRNPGDTGVFNLFFDHVFVLSLPRRRDRLERFLAQWRERTGGEWKIEVAPGIDGRLTGCPDSWMPEPGMPEKERLGSWGCARAHLRIWEEAITRGWRNVLVFEDDCEFSLDFRNRLGAALARMPVRWDFLYLGGELVDPVRHPPRILNSCLLMPWKVNRTHAYAVNAGILPSAYRECSWLPSRPAVGVPARERWHIDWRLGNVQTLPETATLAVFPWIARQRGGGSDIEQEQSGEVENNTPIK